MTDARRGKGVYETENRILEEGGKALENMSGSDISGKMSGLR